MKYKFFNYFLLSLIIFFNLFSQIKEFPKDYVQMHCTLKPLMRNNKKHGTHPLIPYRRAFGTSTNWSGYVAATNLVRPALNSVQSVYGSWIVPAITKSTTNGYCAIWIGIDGYNSSSVEQIGTSHNWIDGAQVHYAWIEMYPNPPLEIRGFPLDIGDSISAIVEFIGNNTFRMRLSNDTKKIYVNVPTIYTRSTIAQRKSAEWIMEAPFMNGILPLANFSTANLFNCETTINGVTGEINNKKWLHQAITMVTSNGTPKAIPSVLSKNGKDFHVTWKHQ